MSALNASAPDPRRWKALALLCGAFFIVVLDVAIVNVALPSIQRELDFSPENLQWVVSAYALTFGGLLLLGGRAADLLGRRRVFFFGVVLFTVASLLCGLAVSDGMLIGARALQGFGAAILTPAALSIISVTFEEGPERNKALGIWGAMGAVGAAAGVLLGGILTEFLGWEWIFFVNVPVGAFVLSLLPVLVAESRVATETKRYDVAGGVTVTAGLVLLVYTLVEANDVGWGSGQTIGLFLASAVLLAAFILVELRAAEPLVPLGIFRLRTLSGANIIGLILGASVFSMFFFLSLYMQQVLQFSALRAGAGYLAVALTAILASGAAQALVTRIGVKPVLTTGMLLLTGGLVWFTQVSVDGSYRVDLLPGFFVIGVGLGFSFVPVSIAALAGVGEAEAGLASGLINTSQQIGGALGIAVLSTVAFTRVDDLLASGTEQPVALTSGFSAAFWVAMGMAVAGALATLALIRRAELIQVEPLPETLRA